MLRIIHTGRAYEVLDDDNCPGLLYTLERLRDMFATARDQYWEQNGVLGETCREVWRLKGLLGNTERKLRATEVEIEQLRRSLHDERIRRDEWKKMYHQAVMPELKSCQKSTLDTHESQDPR